MDAEEAIGEWLLSHDRQSIPQRYEGTTQRSIFPRIREEQGTPCKLLNAFSGRFARRRQLFLGVNGVHTDLSLGIGRAVNGHAHQQRATLSGERNGGRRRYDVHGSFIHLCFNVVGTSESEQQHETVDGTCDPE